PGFERIRFRITGRLRRHGASEDDAEAARPDSDRLHLERNLAREIDAVERAAVRLGHPAWLGDRADKEPALGIEAERQRAEQPLAPEWEARPLIFAVHFFEIGPDDRAAEDKLGDEKLPGERAELAAGLVVSHAIE